MQNPSDDHDPASTDMADLASGLSRRSLMRNAVGAGAATVAAGFLASALAEPAVAAPASAAGASELAPTHAEPVVAHVRDARTGDVDLFVGTRHTRVRDHALAARLANAAR